MKIVTILLASEPILVVCFLKRNCFNSETLELHRRNEVSRRHALHSVRYISRAFDTFAVPERREFDYQNLPGGGEFDPHVLEEGNLNCTLDFM